jgi:phage terminase large subunit-like protein
MTLLEELIQYSNEIIDGKIVACEKHLWACKRFLRDLVKQGTDTFPFIFDEDKAERFLDWMRLFKHRKGILKGQYIGPHIIQKFVFGNIYGWVHKDTGYRRFNKAYWQVARKNAKSQSLSCVGSYELMALGEGASEVYCTATKRKQAKIVWDETEAMLDGCKDLQGKYKVAYGQIKHIKTGSIMEALSKEDGKKGDGYNPQCGIIDEYHAHETSEMYDIIDSGMIARPQPLLMIITTAGFDLNNPCYSVEYKLVSKILDPHNPYDNDNYFVMINELDKGDDIQDEKVWSKANPIVCSYPEGYDSIRKRLKLALEAPEKMRDLLTKTFNIWIQMRESGYMDMSKWAECEQQFTLADFEGSECVGGLDLSTKLDLTSIAFEFKKDGSYYPWQHSFIPEETYEKRLREGKYPFDLWAKQGWLTVTDGAVIDYVYVKKYIQDQEKNYKIKIKEIGFDPYNASQFVQDMEDEGYVMVEVRQGPFTLNEPTKDFRDNVFNKTLKHAGDGLLTWAVSNAVTKQNAQEFIMLDKAKSSEKIDPIAAVINAHSRAMVALEESADIFYSPDI